MNLETEKILGTLEVFTEPRLEFRLPDNEYSSIVPFIWDVTQKGNFSLLNLGRDEGWINKTDIDVAVKSWQSLERRGYLNSDDYPDDYEDILSPESADEREKVYQALTAVIQKNLHSIEALKFSRIPVYSFFVILGKNQNDNWFCISPTVARETKLEGEIKRSLISEFPEQEFLDRETLSLKYEVQTVLEQLQPVSIYGYYGGGYDYTFNHYLVQAIATTKEKALEIALRQAGMLETAKFIEFSIENFAWRFERNEIMDLSLRYQKLNEFLKQNISDLRLIRCSFWNRDCIYVIGEIKSGDLAGVYIESDFHYNP